MIEDIMKIGISEEFYNKLVEVQGYNMVLDMACNYELINKNINTLKSFGITDIESLLLYREYIFFYDTDYIANCLGRLNNPTLISEINEDYTKIDSVFK